MIWIHCGDAREVPSTTSIAARLAHECGDHGVLVTATPDVLLSFNLPEDIATVVAVPTDTPSKIREFWDRWGPDYLIWNGGTLRPSLLRIVENESLPATLINARNAGLLTGSSRWRPRAVRGAVAAFDQVLTADGATATRLNRGGVARDRVKATGPILEEPTAPPHNQYELAVMVEAIDTRPSWFAANVIATEVKDIAAAHLAASRKSHLLLLIITPRDIESGIDVANTLREAGLKVGVRSEGDDPEAEHQAYVADMDGELGLWYRLAPLTFVGGTLGGSDADSPFDPIVLGSAVVHGTHKAPHEARFARLAKAEACREIRSAGELGIAVGVLSSPEQSARMALAGWEEITRNADTINDLVRGVLDSLEVHS
ncbi:3-deoxy-manno-octulosonate cytidylyltransferase [Octadecabacter sp. CECT 8868]|uniref:3-deoxy-D-manno-octulosonic acid transferase n=1 Tax=Octadecabacter algicola TaxID=2909342 RepID=UPI00300D2CDC|nr:3-deoxy-manno-octulosonate cytidylyltransferase [Octadecabacter algicola]